MHFGVYVFHAEPEVDLDEVLSPWGEGNEWDYWSDEPYKDFLPGSPPNGAPLSCRQLTSAISKTLADNPPYAFVFDGRCWIPQRVRNPLFDSAQLADIQVGYGGVGPDCQYMLDNPYFTQAFLFTLNRCADQYVTVIDCHN